MTYRVIYSDFIYNSKNGSYEVISGTEKSLGTTESIHDAHSTSLSWDSRYHIAWLEKLVDNVWYPCDHNGHLYDAKIPADPQEVPLDE